MDLVANHQKELLIEGTNLIGSDKQRAEKVLLKSLQYQNPIDSHFAYNQLINLYYKQRDKPGYLEKCIDICKKDIELYPLFKQASIDEDIRMIKRTQRLFEKGSKDYKRFQQEIDNYVWIKPRIPSFQQLAIIYEKQEKYAEAIDICKLAVKYQLNDGTKGGFTGRLSRLEKKLQRQKSGLPAPARKKRPKRELTTIEQEQLLDVPIDSNCFMITFSKSTSNNFDRALFLAKQADQYFEGKDNNNKIVYQAVYSPDNHLSFIALYELIRDWKSTFVFKDGKMIDRKILGQINYCYGDKLRSQDESFCYGASMFTENPFGCHRLLIHSGQTPWFEWKAHEDNRFVYIDKEAMGKQIDEKAAIFRLCPSFNYDSIIHTLNKLPYKIDKQSKQYRDLYETKPDGVINIKVNYIDSANKTRDNRQYKPIKQKQNIGCGTLILLFIIGIFIMSV